MEKAYVALPLLSDTEAETSFELDGPLENHSKRAENTAKRRSLFNLTFENIKSPSRPSEDFKSLGDYAQKELIQWNELFLKLKSDLKQASAKHPELDISILPEEKRKFLMDEPNMDVILHTIHDFQCEAFKFLENDFPAKMLMRKNIKELCEQKMELAKQIKMQQLHNSVDIL